MSFSCDTVEMMVSPEDCDNVSHHGEQCFCNYRLNTGEKLVEGRYNTIREKLVKERIRLMDLLESQENFPDEQTLAEYESNKRQIMSLDDAWKAQQRREKHES